MEHYCILKNMDTRDHFSSEIIMELNNAFRRFLIRLTGGAAYIDIDQGISAVSLFRKALRGYDGILLCGGTRVIKITDTNLYILPTIMEVPPILKLENPNMKVLGVIPRQDSHKLTKWGIVISEQPEVGCVTIINTEQDVCLTIQQDVDTPAKWDVEWQSCLDVALTYKSTGRNRPFGCALIAYEGGEYTKKEILAWADNNLPVLLIKNSGRVTDYLCRNQKWLYDHPSVRVCEDADDVRKYLIELGGLPND